MGAYFSLITNDFFHHKSRFANAVNTKIPFFTILTLFGVFFLSFFVFRFIILFPAFIRCIYYFIYWLQYLNNG